MYFGGWWVSGNEQGVKVDAARFDETELSETSGWQKAHQNEDPVVAHGFIDAEAMLREVRRRLRILD